MISDWGRAQSRKLFSVVAGIGDPAQRDLISGIVDASYSGIRLWKA